VHAQLACRSQRAKLKRRSKQAGLAPQPAEKEEETPGSHAARAAAAARVFCFMPPFLSCRLFSTSARLRVCCRAQRATANRCLGATLTTPADVRHNEPRRDYGTRREVLWWRRLRKWNPRNENHAGCRRRSQVAAQSSGQVQCGGRRRSAKRLNRHASLKRPPVGDVAVREGAIMPAATFAQETATMPRMASAAPGRWVGKPRPARMR